MQTVQTVPFVITVSAPQWKAYREAKAKASAADREAKQLGEQLGIPDATDLAKALKLNPDNGSAGEAVIQDGNGNPIGKVSVYRHPGATIPAGWRKRES